MATELLKAALMLVFTAFSALAYFALSGDLPAYLAEICMPIHEACLQLSPNSVHKFLYQGIVCGADLPRDSTQENLRTTGLLHIMVVSGSHLVFLEQIIQLVTRIVKIPKLVVIFVLVVFTLASRAEPPVLRALFSYLTQILNHSHALGLTSVQITTISGVFSLAFCQSPQDSFSLLLSWLASLAMGHLSTEKTDGNTGSKMNNKAAKESLLTAARVYLFLVPALFPLALAHPLSILCNWVLAPILGLLLFPVSLLTFLIPPAAKLVDLFWDLTLWLLQMISSVMPTPLLPVSTSKSWLWAYLFLLTMLLLFWEHLERSNYSVQKSLRKSA